MPAVHAGGQFARASLALHAHVRRGGRAEGGVRKVVGHGVAAARGVVVAHRRRSGGQEQRVQEHGGAVRKKAGPKIAHFQGEIAEISVKIAINCAKNTENLHTNTGKSRQGFCKRSQRAYNMLSGNLRVARHASRDKFLQHSRDKKIRMGYVVRKIANM